MPIHTYTHTYIHTRGVTFVPNLEILATMHNVNGLYFCQDFFENYYGLPYTFSYSWNIVQHTLNVTEKPIIATYACNHLCMQEAKLYYQCYSCMSMVHNIMLESCMFLPQTMALGFPSALIVHVQGKDN